MPAAQVERFRRLVFDVIDSEGHRVIQIELPDTEIVDLRLLEALVDAEQAVSGQGGELVVRTPSGSWGTASR